MNEEHPQKTLRIAPKTPKGIIISATGIVSLGVFKLLFLSAEGDAGRLSRIIPSLIIGAGRHDSAVVLDLLVNDLASDVVEDFCNVLSGLGGGLKELKPV